MVEKIDREIKLHKYHIIADIVLIIVFILVGIFVAYNLRDLWTVGSDVCKLCMNKVPGTICSKLSIP